MVDNPSSPGTAEMGFMHRFLRLAGPFFMVGDQRWKATAALDDDNLKAMISIFKGELRWTTLLPVGHRSCLENFHDRSLHLVKTKSGAHLTMHRRTSVARGLTHAHASTHHAVLRDPAQEKESGVIAAIL
jgi:hypothetical protein